MTGIRSKRKWLLIALAALGLCYTFSLPSPLFKDPYSTVLLDRRGFLLNAKIAADGQWRFPKSDSIPFKFKQCLLHFEDEHFYYHPGFNPISLFKALWQNISSGEIKRGASTLTLQTIRLSRKGKARTLWEKLIEIVLSTRLEISYSKERILSFYCSHAPFGGNVVGVEAASWRYFGRPSYQLSWAEAATLAVLPNAPSLIFPGKNHPLLEKKRNALLQKLLRHEVIDSSMYYLSLLEGLPQKPYPLPRYSPHLLERAAKEPAIVQTTIDISLQKKSKEIIQKHSTYLEANHIHNAAVLVLEVETCATLVYVGNSDKKGEDFGQDVDIITAHRSTGSILKPFLYALCLQDGIVLPQTLVADIPTQIAGYTPKNFDNTYDGAVPAKRIIARSLNIPAVRLLHEYSYERFYHELKKLGMSTLTKNADHYGLSLILGGAEGKLEEICGIYASLARRLNHYTDSSSSYFEKDMSSAHFMEGQSITLTKTNMDAGSVWLMFNAMKEVHRPYQEQGWEYFASSQNIAWKTGTSFGNRDGWAVGITPKYVVGVWVGNASGDGRPELTGIGTAAPILFDVFNHLPKSEWFATPYDALMKIAVCRESGHRPSEICLHTDSVWVQKAGLETPPCPYHHLVHLDKSGRHQVNSTCENPENMRHEPWFVLPPIMEWYYKSKSPAYKKLPPYKKGCIAEENNMELIYPRTFTGVFIPKEMNGERGKVVFEAAHRKAKAIIYWHIDNEYAGETNSFHKIAVSPSVGKHKLTLVDDKGEVLEKWFEVVE